MKGSISRAKLCRQQDLREISIAIAKSTFSSAGVASAPVVGGLDFSLIQSIERLSAGEYKITCKSRAYRDLVIAALIPADANIIGQMSASDEQTITIKTQTIKAIVGTKASRIIQDLTYLADANGLAGNSITIAYTDRKSVV